MNDFPRWWHHTPSLPDAHPRSDRFRCGGRESEFLAVVLLTCLSLGWAMSSQAQSVVLNTGTRGGVELDFDGAPEGTLGLGFNEKIFVLTGAEIPAIPAFASITSITLTFTAIGGELSADNGGINPIGIGISSGGDGTAANRSLLSAGTGELLTISVSSTASTPHDQVTLAGLSLVSWRDVFPVSQATFTGATVGGLATVTGDEFTPTVFPIAFDAPVGSVSISSTGDDDFRLSGVAFTVVPEPSAVLLTATSLLYLGTRRLRRNA